MKAAANAKEPIQEIVAAARVGQKDALAQVRAWFAARAPADEPHVFAVATDGIISDCAAGAPRRRRDVLPSFQPFVRRDPLLRVPIALPGPAIEQVRACPPLAQAFARAAFEHVGLLQTRLVVDQTLQASDRRKMQRELALLLDQGRPIWENWIRLAPDHLHAQFDRLVSCWLDEPPEPGEERCFVDGWSERLRWAAAADFFAALVPEVRVFLGVALDTYELRGQRGLRATLREPWKDTNRWAMLLKARIAFVPG